MACGALQAHLVSLWVGSIGSPRPGESPMPENVPARDEPKVDSLPAVVDAAADAAAAASPSSAVVPPTVQPLAGLHAFREAWLQAAVDHLRPLFAARGYEVPPVRVSIGWPGTGQRSQVEGECWPRKAAEDGVNQIFIAPNLGNACKVIDVLTHELVHAVDDCKHRHGKEFRAIALKVGLVGPEMRSASAGKELRATLEAIAARLGPFPHGPLARRLPSTRRSNPPRARCPQCSYRLAIPRRFLHLGPPLCPEHRVEMLEEGDWL